MNKENKKLTPYLSKYGAWAFSIGNSIGWGSLVVTAESYLAQAGPIGSFVGILIAGVVMYAIARNYSYLINGYPEAGGAYTYAKEAFGYDYGALTSWFLILTYVAMLWANATSLPLFASYLFGDIFKFGYVYTIFNYDVYLGEALLSIFAILVTGLVCINSRKVTEKIMIIMSSFFTIGIVACFVLSFLKLEAPISPSFAPGGHELRQIVQIICVSPWAFIGFENISHGVEEYNFPRKKALNILTYSIATNVVLYIMIILLSSSTYPQGYASWVEYLAAHTSLEGILRFPAIFAANHYLGRIGVIILYLSLLCLVLTSLISNIVTLIRIFYSLGKDNILPKKFIQLNQFDIPQFSIILAMIISCIVPFFGRTAIGWVVDVTTIGATITYGIVSGAAYKIARDCDDKKDAIFGIIGIVSSIFFGLFILVSDLFSRGMMARETYFIFIVWTLLGFIFFRMLLKKDNSNNYGVSIVVLISLLSLLLMVTLVWMNQDMVNNANVALDNIHGYLSVQGTNGINEFMAVQLDNLRTQNAVEILIVILLFTIALGILMSSYSAMSKRAIKSEKELGRDPLTGLKSRHAFMDKEKELNNKIKTGEIEEFAIVVADVNDLKIVNDTNGHKAGDKLIFDAGRLLAEVFKFSPVYRIGGDEFAAVLTGRDYENRQALIKTINNTVEENLKNHDVIVSVGISKYDKEKDNEAKDVFIRADEQMYIRKQGLKSLSVRIKN